MLKTRSRLRLMVVQVMVLSLFITLFARLWYIQVVGGDGYQAAAQDNAVRDIDVPAPRGLIVDAMGRPLVANRTSWVVTVDRDVLDKLGDSTRNAVMARLANTLGLTKEELERRTKTCGEKGAAKAPICWNGSPYEPVPVAEDVTQNLAASILEQSEDYPGITAESRKVRAYPSPFGINAAHVLGYISPITEQELDRAKKDGDKHVSPLSYVGRSGLEASYDRWLRGRSGVREVSVDSMGRVLAHDGTTQPRPGDTLVTSLDAKVQSVVERELKRSIMAARRTTDPVTHRKYVADAGSVVVMDAKTGRLVAMASYPTYDPDVWVGGISEGDLKRLYSSQAGTPLLSRAMQGLFAPGSTFKPITTAGALTHGYKTTDRLDCSSSLTVGSRVFKNYESAAYGPLTFAQALQLSCDTFFYRIAYAKWLAAGADDSNVHIKDDLVDNAKAFGFGSKTGIDLPGEVSGPDRRPEVEAGVLEGQQGLLLRARQEARHRLPARLRARVLHRRLPLPRRRRGQLRDRPGRHRAHAAAARGRVRRDLQRRNALGAAGRQGRRQRQGPRDQADPADGQGPRADPVPLPALHRPGAARHGEGRHDGLEDGRLPARQGLHPLQDRHGGGLRQADDLVGRELRQAVRRDHADRPGRHRVGCVG